MARIVIERGWPDGDGLRVTAKVDTSYPDAFAECKRIALDAYAEALGLTLAGNESAE